MDRLLRSLRRTNKAVSNSQPKSSAVYWLALILFAAFVSWTVIVRVGITEGSRRTTWQANAFGTWPEHFGRVDGSYDVQLSIFASYVGSTQADIRIFGNAAVGTDIDNGDSSVMNAARFTSGITAGDVSSLSAYIAGSVDAPPHNQFEMAIYTDEHGGPGTLVSRTETGILKPDSWNTLTVAASLRPLHAYWLVFNTNSTAADLNTLVRTPFVGSPIDHIIQSNSNPDLDSAARVLVRLGNVFPTSVVMLFLAIWVFKNNRALGLVLLATFGAGLLIEFSLKHLVFQPYQEYPSGHVMRIVLLSWAGSSVFPRWYAHGFGSILALLVGWSVVYTYGHAADEVFGGVLAGVSIALTAKMFLSEFRRLRETRGLYEEIKTPVAAA